jgi:succinylarginine dihydrolase
LRIVLTERERGALGAAVILDAARIVALEAIVKKHYRDRLAPADLADPTLLVESRTALDEIGEVLKLGPVHDFQCN